MEYCTNLNNGLQRSCVPSLSDARSGRPVRSLRRRGVGVEHHLRLAWGGEQRDAARKKVHLRVWQRLLTVSA